MFLRHVFMEEQDEAGNTAVAPEVDLAQRMEAAVDAANEADETEPEAELDEPADEPDESPGRKRNERGQFVSSGADDEETPESEPETPAEPSSISEMMESAGENFLTDELREMGRSYGFSDDVMLSQGSEESLRGAMELIDRYVANQTGIGQKPPPGAVPPEQAPIDQPVDPAAPEQPAGFVPETEEPTPESQDQFLTYIENLKTNGYDDEITQPMEALYHQNQQMMQHIQQLQSHAHQVQEGAIGSYQKQVLGFIDGLDRSDLFGTEHEFSPQQQENAHKMDEAVQFLTRSQGQPLNPSTVQRAFNLAFGETLMREKVAARTSAIQNQSRKRMGSGAPSTPRDDIPWDGEAGDDPVIKQFFNNAMQENGFR